MTNQQELNELAAQMGVSPETLLSMATMSASFLTKSYGSSGEAAEALTNFQSENVAIAIDHCMGVTKKMAVRFSLNSGAMTAAVHDLLTA